MLLDLISAVRSCDVGDVINGDKRGIAAFQSVTGLICIEAGLRRCRRLDNRWPPDLLVAASAIERDRVVMAHEWLREKILLMEKSGGYVVGFIYCGNVANTVFRGNSQQKRD